MASADVTVFLDRGEGERATVTLHEGSGGQPTAVIHLRGAAGYVTVRGVAGVEPSDLSSQLREMADKVDEAHAAWLAEQAAGEGSDA